LAAPAAGKKYRKLNDGAGLCLVVNASTKVWRLEYRLNGKETGLGLGRYPEVGLEQARRLAAAAREKIKTGRNPADENREARNAAWLAASTTFLSVGREYLGVKMADKRPATVAKNEWLLAHCLERLHNRPLVSIGPRDILAECRRYEAQGKRETAHRIASFARRVFKFAKGNGLFTGENPAAELELAPTMATARAAIVDPVKFGKLMNAVDSEGYASSTVRHAMMLLARTAVRPGEVRGALWSEFDLTAAEWTISAARMKMRKQHWVPLSWQAVEILKAQWEISGGEQFVFPMARTNKRPISDGTLGAALAVLGYKPGGWMTLEGHVPHGFRSSFSTMMNELDENPRIIELCLAHGDDDKVAGVYNRAERKQKRRELMQKWSDFIDELKRGAV
jgi:integrase